MAEIPRVLREGLYLTDGTHLVQIKRVLDDSVTLESGSTDAPEYFVIGKADVASGWRIVDPAEDDGATDAWLATRFGTVTEGFVVDARTRCGCSRCLASLTADDDG